MILLKDHTRCGICITAAMFAGLMGVGKAAWADDNASVSIENIPNAEASDIDKTTALTTRLQNLRAKNDASQHGQTLRGVHAKSHGCLRASFAVGRDIAPELKVGLFEQSGKTYKSWIRFSNAAVLRQDDMKANDKGVRQNGSRGMAIKILDVPGKMLETSSGRQDQDFLMINTPEFAFVNVRDYLRLNSLLERSPKGDVAKPYFIPAILARLGEPKDGEPVDDTKLRTFLQTIVKKDPLLRALSAEDIKGTLASAGVLKKISDEWVANPTEVQYFGAAPFLFGPGKVMKFSVAPCKATARVKLDKITPDSPSKDYLREALAKTAEADHNLCFDFKVQVREADSTDLNIENATTTWPDEGAGYINVARITVELPQSPHTTEAIKYCEKLAFSPWHSLAAHRPLGGINRVRRKVYSESAKNRKADGY